MTLANKSSVRLCAMFVVVIAITIHPHTGTHSPHASQSKSIIFVIRVSSSSTDCLTNYLLYSFNTPLLYIMIAMSVCRQTTAAILGSHSPQQQQQQQLFSHPIHLQLFTSSRARIRVARCLIDLSKIPQKWHGKLHDQFRNNKTYTKSGTLF